MKHGLARWLRMALALAMAARSGPGASRPRADRRLQGIKVGHHTLSERPTGCTVILVDGEGAVGGVVAARRRARHAGNRPARSAQHGGQGQRGRAVRRQRVRARRGAGRCALSRRTEHRMARRASGVVPIVPAAILFDLGFGGDPKIRPTADCGYRGRDGGHRRRRSRKATSAQARARRSARWAAATLDERRRRLRGDRAPERPRRRRDRRGQRRRRHHRSGHRPGRRRRAHAGRQGAGRCSRAAAIRCAWTTGSATSGRKHHDRPRRHQREADEERHQPRGADGRRWIRARHQSVAHDRRRRHGVRARHRTLGGRSERHDGRRAGGRSDGRSDRARGVAGRERRGRPVRARARHRPGAAHGERSDVDHSRFWRTTRSLGCSRERDVRPLQPRPREWSRSSAPARASANRWPAGPLDKAPMSCASTSRPTPRPRRRIGSARPDGVAESATVDITDSEAVEAVLDRIVLGHDRLDAVVCTPAINVRKKILDYTDDEFDRVVRVNLKGTFNVVRAAGRIMMPCKAGSIVVFSSIRSQVVEPGQSVYAMTKAGVVQIVRTAAAEFGPVGHPRERHRPGRRRNAADGADHGQAGVVRGVREQERVQAVGIAGGDGRADVVPDFRRRQLRDRNHSLRRRRLARGRRPLHTTGCACDRPPIDTD